MNYGWVKLWRKFIAWEWYQDQTVKAVFLHLLLTASHEDRQWRGVTVKRGQVIIGRQKLARSLGLTERATRTALKKLESTSELTIKTTNKFSIVTINNFDDYQDLNDQQNRQQNDQQLTSKRPAERHKQEDKNDKNEEKILIHRRALTQKEKKEYDGLLHALVGASDTEKERVISDFYIRIGE